MWIDLIVFHFWKCFEWLQEVGSSSFTACQASTAFLRAGNVKTRPTQSLGQCFWFSFPLVLSPFYIASEEALGPHNSTETVSKWSQVGMEATCKVPAGRTGSTAPDWCGHERDWRWSSRSSSSFLMIFTGSLYTQSGQRALPGEALTAWEGRK